MAVIGLWGAFEGDLGSLLFPHVARAELDRLIPGVELRIWSPSGRDLPSGFEPLGEWSEERLDELAASAGTLVIVEGARLGRFGEGLGRREAYVPTLRLSEDDVAAAAGLARRVFDDEPLEARIGRLRALGGYPATEALVVQGDMAKEEIDEVCRTEGFEAVALDHEDLEDRVAAIAWAGAFVGDSPAARAVARSFGRRVLFADDEPVDAMARADEVFDRIAAIALRDAPAVTDPGEDGLTRALALRLAAQHAAFAERERALLDLIEGLTREINEKDIRFTRLWQKLHKADRLYNWHINRADFYEDLAIKRQDALDKLRLLGPLRTRVRRKIARTALGRFLAKVLRKLKGKPV